MGQSSWWVGLRGKCLSEKYEGKSGKQGKETERVKAEKRGGSRRREDRWGGRKEGEEPHSYGVSCIYMYIYPRNSPERKELLPLFYRFGD